MKNFSVKKTYNEIAKEYYDSRIVKKTDSYFYNTCLEMPTTIKLLGDLKGKNVLDLGCGPGIYAKILSKKGAKVKGIDISDKEIEIARKDNPKIDFEVGTIEKLPYKNKSFDVVLSALVLEYLDDWTRVLSEVKRVLKKGGFFVFSMHNPVSACIKIKQGKAIVKNYFNEKRFEKKWPKSLRNIKMVWYNKTYEKIVKLLVKKGFELTNYEDAKPLVAAKKLFPKEYKMASMRPYFCTWKWKKK